MSVNPAPSSSHPRLQGALRRLVEPAAFAVALGASAGAASLANAAECVNGYRTLCNQVILLCDEAGPPPSTALYPRAAPAVVPPVASDAAPARAGSIMVDSADECQPGMYWTYYLEDGEVILAC